MNITSPIMAGAVRVAELPGDSVTSFLRMIGAGTGLFDDSVDGGLGLVMSALAGVAAALAVAIMLSIYFRSGDRSPRDLIKHAICRIGVPLRDVKPDFKEIGFHLGRTSDRKRLRVVHSAALRGARIARPSILIRSSSRGVSGAEPESMPS